MEVGDNIETNYKEVKVFIEEQLGRKDPFYLFDKWFKIAENDQRSTKANAMCLSTCTKTGFPSARFVLMKGYSKNGFIFFTHYTSRKGQEIEENPNVAVTFYWEHFSRSVRVEGVAEKLPFSAANDYFKTRPYLAQIGSSSSNQSKPITGRSVLDSKKKELINKYKEGEVPRPSLWGGYIIKPQRIEFWQGQTDKLHDRIRFRKPEVHEPDGIISFSAEDGWIYEKLSP